jgi:hypothetical protein
MSIHEVRPGARSIISCYRFNVAIFVFLYTHCEILLSFLEEIRASQVGEQGRVSNTLYAADRPERCRAMLSLVITQRM